MAEINFPSTPFIGEPYTFGNKTWIWNGYAWDFNGVVSIVPSGYGSHVFSHGPIDPVDEELYIFGDIPDDYPITTDSPNGKIVCLHDGGIEQFSIMIHNGTVGSTEESTFELINESAGDLVLFSDVFSHGEDTLKTFYVNPSTQVNKGDILYMKWSTPIWETNPTQVRTRVEIKIKLSAYA